jgi:amino acid transporter
LTHADIFFTLTAVRQGSIHLPIPNNFVVTSVSSHDFKKLKLGAFVAVLYSYCAAGPFGFEDMVANSGPGMTLIFLLVIPWIFSMPMSLATAEMASCLPQQGGFYRWSLRAFGDFWGFQCGWWNWVGTFLMNAAYATILADYTVQLFPLMAINLFGWSGAGHWFIALFFLVIVAVANIRGIHVVGISSIVLLVLCLLPVALFTVLGLIHMKVNPFHPWTPPGKSWSDVYGVGLALGLWIYSGYEQLSTNVEEVEDPGRNFARGLAIMVPLAMLTFFLPMMAGIGAGDWQNWTSGYIVTAAHSVGQNIFGARGGIWLENGMFAAAIISVLLGLQSTLMSSTRLPFALAEDGFFPIGFAQVNEKFKTPIRAILLTTLFCTPLALFDLPHLISTYIWLRVGTSILTLLSVGKLRQSEPDLPRGYRIPGGQLGLAAVIVVPTLLFAWFLFNSDPSGRFWGPICIITGPVAFLLGRLFKKALPST